MNLSAPELRAALEALLPVIVVIAGAMLVLGLDLFLRPNASRVPLEALTYLALLAALFLILQRFSLPGATVMRGAFRDDLFARMTGMTILGATLLFTLLSSQTVEQRNLRAAEFLSLALFCTAGMMLLTLSADLVSLFISIELLSLALYALTGMSRGDRRSIEAGVKYFVNGSFASAFLLLGMALIYGATGTLSFDEMNPALRPATAQAGLILLLAGFAFKIGAVPFHFWVPDVYEGAPTAVTAFMSAAVKTAAFAALLRLLRTSFWGETDVWGPPVWALAAATMIVGNLLALRQQSVKRMLAYSSVAHGGYVLTGVAARATDAAVFYLFVYTFLTLGAFAFLMHGRPDEREGEGIDSYAGLGRRRPWAAAAMTLFLISLGGIPPTSGFFGKFALFEAAVRAGFPGLVVIGVLSSAVSLYFYLRVVVYLYMKEPAGEVPSAAPEAGSTLVLAITSLFTILLGLFPTNCLQYARLAAERLAGF